jgi:hypothetical protein
MLEAEVPLIVSKHSVPATFQQNRPALTPLFILLCDSAVDAGHTPRLSALDPFGSRPHFINSQQFCFVFLFIMRDLHLLQKDDSPDKKNCKRWKGYTYQFVRVDNYIFLNEVKLGRAWF